MTLRPVNTGLCNLVPFLHLVGQPSESRWRRLRRRGHRDRLDFDGLQCRDRLCSSLALFQRDLFVQSRNSRLALLDQMFELGEAHALLAEGHLTRRLLGDAAANLGAAGPGGLISGA
jgi:hypothetical protein